MLVTEVQHIGLLLAYPTLVKQNVVQRCITALRLDMLACCTCNLAVWHNNKVYMNTPLHSKHKIST